MYIKLFQLVLINPNILAYKTLPEADLRRQHATNATVYATKIYDTMCVCYTHSLLKERDQKCYQTTCHILHTNTGLVGLFFAINCTWHPLQTPSENQVSIWPSSVRVTGIISIKLAVFMPWLVIGTFFLGGKLHQFELISMAPGYLTRVPRPLAQIAQKMNLLAFDGKENPVLRNICLKIYISVLEEKNDNICVERHKISTLCNLT